MKTQAIIASAADAQLVIGQIERRNLLPIDVEIEIHYCGVCHSDIHTARGDWGAATYPCVPGHEITGVVSSVGQGVTKFAVGEQVAVGVIVNSCRSCKECSQGLEQYCSSDGYPTYTYGSADPADQSDTKGGYAKSIVTTEDFVLKLPAGMDMAKAAPLLCAGITMYSPLKHWKVGEGSKVGIIGIGTSIEKSADAIKYGADNVLVSTDEQQMQQYQNYFDLIIDTIPSTHDLQPYIGLIGSSSTLVLVGPISPLQGFDGGSIIGSRKTIAGSCIGSIAETQEMLEYCAINNIYPEIELIAADKVNEAWDKMVAKSMSHRYVIDIKNTL
jgi:alcohol dehydrogenase (NADP+)